MNIKDLEEKLFEMQDKKYKEFYSSLCPGTTNIIGIRVPNLRNFAKDLIKGKDYNWILELKPRYYEEIMLQGMIIGLKKSNLSEILEDIKNFIPKIDNWSTNDTFCAGLKIVKIYPEDFWLIINKYLQSNKEFELRFAIVMMLDYYINDLYIDEILTILNNIKHEGYYVKMAVAWTVAECYIKFSDKTMNFLCNCELDIFTYNKSIQKIIESYRVSDEDKTILRKMKK